MQTRTDIYYETRVYFGYAQPATRRFASWQAAYAYAKTIMYEDCGISKVDVIKRTFDAYIYQGMRTYVRNVSPQAYAVRAIAVA
jgi:hypothetical protein